MNEFNEIIEFDALYDSYIKCRKNVGWKPSVKSFCLNDEENIIRMSKQLQNGTWKNGQPKKILLTYPKRREALSISFKDRIYQRSINDNILYPKMTKKFIYANCACQKGKGTSVARRIFKEMLWNYYRNNGLEGYILQIDISGYYLNMKHDEVINKFGEEIEPNTLSKIQEILDNQYQGEKGYNPGSQMVQIAGISYLDKMDHLIKEKLHIKYYVRYMDDFILIHHDKEYLKYCRQVIDDELEKLGLRYNKKKTHIQKFAKPFTFLGFKYRITKTGKVIMSVDSQNVKHERRKLKRMVNKVKRGDLTIEKVETCFRGWCDSHAAQGNSNNLINRMRKYLNNLWKEAGLYEDYSKIYGN